MTRPNDKQNTCRTCHWWEEVLTTLSRALCAVACMCEDSDHYCHILSEDHPACEQYERAQ